jgi:intein/homing endonuclease
MSWEQGIQKYDKDDANERIANTKGFIEERQAKLLLYEFLRDNTTFAVDLLSGVKLFPFQHMAIKSMFKTDYFLGVWCLDQNEYVLTKSGFKKIKNIEVGDQVRSRKKLNSVSDKWTNKEEDGLFISTQSGDSFKAKIGHKTLVYDTKGEFKFKNIKDITTEDYIPIKLGTEVWGNKNITKNSKIKRSPYLFYLLGYVLGDGYINKDGIHYCSENIEIQDTILNFIKENNLKSYSRQRSENLNFYEYSIYNRKLVCFLEGFGWDKSLKSKRKVIPDELLQSSKQELCALIGGLFDADGYASYLKNSSKVGLKNTSLEMLRQIKMLLNNLGVQSSLRKSGEHDGAPYYDLILSNDYHSLLKFQNEIDFIVKHKKDNLKKIIQRSKKRNYQNNLVPDLGKVLRKQGSFKEIIGKRGSWSDNFSQNRFKQLNNLDANARNLINEIQKERVVFSKVQKIQNCKTTSVDITVENEENYIGNGIVHHNSRGMSKSFTTAIFAYLDAILNQGVEIGILSKSFRQAKMIFRKIEDIAAKPEAKYLAQCITRKSKQNDQWTLEFGQSKIHALPLGDGEKLRGFRFHRIIIDEFLLMPERVYNEVIVPFLSVVQNPTQREELYQIESKLIEQGKMKEEERHKWPNNKLITLSSASYKFEYMYKLYQEFENLIHGHLKEEDNPYGENARRVIMHFSYDCAPKALYDQNLINQARASMSQSQFDREFGAIFTDDSSGYFKTSTMAKCTVPDGDEPSIEIAGDPKAKYILAFDPSWAETESSDDFAMQVLKLNESNNTSVLIHSYALPGAKLKDHINYFHYLLKSFNIVAIIGDYNGGVQFINSVNESQLFKEDKIQINLMDVKFDDLTKYEESLREAKSQYNSGKTCYLRTPSSIWIRQANELLQRNFDHKKIWFGARAINDSYQNQRKKNIPIEGLKYLPTTADNGSMNMEKGARMIDFLEHQHDMINLTKAECALIQIKTSPQGTQTFDLPDNLKRQTGPNKPRKDSYSALVLGNWMVGIYYDMMNAQDKPIYQGFTPMFIR